MDYEVITTIHYRVPSLKDWGHFGSKLEAWAHDPDTGEMALYAIMTSLFDKFDDFESITVNAIGSGLEFRKENRKLYRGKQ